MPQQKNIGPRSASQVEICAGWNGAGFSLSSPDRSRWPSPSCQRCSDRRAKQHIKVHGWPRRASRCFGKIGASQNNVEPREKNFRCRGSACKGRNWTSRCSKPGAIQANVRRVGMKSHVSLMDLVICALAGGRTRLQDRHRSMRPAITMFALRGNFQAVRDVKRSPAMMETFVRRANLFGAAANPPGAASTR